MDWLSPDVIPSPAALTGVTEVIALIISFFKCRAAIEVACRNAPAASLPPSLVLRLSEWVALTELAFILDVSQPISQPISLY